MEPRFFRTAAGWREWLDKHHSQKTELLVGFYKKSSGKPSLTWPESVDEALCFGWIDGIRRTIDDLSYSIRFTPRRPRSNWSAVNIRRVEELTRQKRMQPAGIAAFAARPEDGTGVYSFARQKAAFDMAGETQFRANPAAWSFFQTQSPSYRRLATFWVVSAKREDTRATRLLKLIAASEENRRLF